jgi:hypothetical protein
MLTKPVGTHEKPKANAYHRSKRMNADQEKYKKRFLMNLISIDGYTRTDMHFLLNPLQISVIRVISGKILRFFSAAARRARMNAASKA